MKKQFFLPILALVLGVAASAFTHVDTKQRPKANTEVWFYDGSTEDPEELYDAGNYSQTSSGPCNETIGVPCEIHFDSGQYPNGLQEYLDAVEAEQDVLNVDSRKP